MGAIGVIALNAFRESLRDKILYNLVLFAGLLIGLSVLLADLSITEHHKVIVGYGFSGHQPDRRHHRYFRRHQPGQ
jgi:Cu-processing system permease protein